jgi:hypothetical protein
MGGQDQNLPINTANPSSGNDIYDPNSPQSAKIRCKQKNRCFFIQDSKTAAAEANKANAGQFKKKKKNRY